MGKLGRVALPSLFLSALLYLSAIAQDSRGITVASERLALVIGNNSYSTAPLQNPVNDAEDMSKALTSLGFKVVLQKNVDRRTMEDSIRAFGRNLKNGGVGLFYYAGHGVQVEGRNYLIPVNARIESESDIKYEAVDVGFVLGKMEDAANQLNIVILDACRNNPYSRLFRSQEQGLARMDAPTGSLVAYSTAPGSIAADGNERNGVFTKHLLRHLQEPNLSIEQVLKRVRVAVASETRQRQIPWESSSLMGDFYFKLDKAAAVADQQTPEQYAALPTTTLEQTVSTPKKKLAIFPFYFHNDLSGQWSMSVYAQTYVATNRRAAISTLREALFDHLDFDPAYSFYELNEKYSFTKIDPNLLNEDSVKDLWVERKPDFDRVANLAKRIGAESVFLAYYPGGFLRLALVEINDKKIFFKESPCAVYSGYSLIPKLIREFFETYKSSRIE